MKKLIALMAALSFLMAPMTVNAITMRGYMEQVYGDAEVVFPDMPNTHPNFAGVSFLVEDEVIQGYPDGTFKPDGEINRAELMKMIVSLVSPGTDPDSSYYKNCFPDVTTDWYAPYVCYGKEAGWIEGYPDGTYKPANNVNRVEAMKIVMNAMIEDPLWPTPTESELLIPLPADADPNAWYKGYLLFGIAKELLDGQHVVGTSDNYTYKPGEPMTRKEVAEMMWRIYVYMVERMEYANLITETACFQIEHSDLSEEDQMALWVDEILTPFGYTQEEADMLSDKYIDDDVLTELKADGIATKCGDPTGVDMSKWDGFKLFAR
jgi:hypothetical protein